MPSIEMESFNQNLIFLNSSKELGPKKRNRNNGYLTDANKKVKFIFTLSDHTYEENEKLTQKYFSILSDADILDLGDIYRRDFDIFGYSFQIRNITISPKFPI